MKLSKKFAVIVTAIIASSLLMTGCNKEEEENSDDIVYYTTADSSSDKKLGEKNDEETEAAAEDDDSKAEVKEEETKAEETEPVIEAEILEGTVGEVAVQAGIEVTLEKIERIKFDEKDSIAGYAVFNIKNVTDKDIPVNSIEHFHISPDGAEHDMDYVTSLLASSLSIHKLEDIEMFNGQTIASGNSLKGYISFEVPSSTSELSLTYYPYIYSDSHENTVGYQFKVNTSELEVIE